MFQAEAAEKIKVHISKPFVENRAVYGVLWKNTAEQDGAKYDNMVHAHCMLGT